MGLQFIYLFAHYLNCSRVNTQTSSSIIVSSFAVVASIVRGKF